MVPPAPLQTFDFRRPPISKEKAPKNIILKGSIREDGSVANLQVYQGIMRGGGRNRQGYIQPMEVCTRHARGKAGSCGNPGWDSIFSHN